MLALALLVSLAGPPPDASATGPAATPPPTAVPEPPVRWDAPPGCPDVQVVSDRIADLLGRTVEPGEIELHGTIAAVGTGWSLQLDTRVGDLVDSRSLDADDCSVLADAAALVAVVMLDPVLAASTIETRAAAAAAITKQTEKKTTPPPPTLPEAEPEPAKKSTKRAPRRWDRPPPRKREPGEPPGMWLRLRGGGEFGAIPQGTGGFDLALALGGDRLRGEIAGAYYIGRPTRDGLATVHLGAVAPRVCGMIAAGPIDVPLCAGLEFGAMLARGRGAGINDATRFWFAAQAEPGIRWAFAKRVSLWVSVQAFVPIVYPAFELRDPTDDTRRPQDVHKPSPAGLRGLAGLEFRLIGTERGR